MAVAASIPPWSPAQVPLGSMTALRRHAFDDGQGSVDCGSGVLVTGDAVVAEWESEGDFSVAQVEQFLAGAPLTLGWITRSPGGTGGESVYVYCWVTVGD